MGRRLRLGKGPAGIQALMEKNLGARPRAQARIDVSTSSRISSSTCMATPQLAWSRWVFVTTGADNEPASGNGRSLRRHACSRGWPLEIQAPSGGQRHTAIRSRSKRRPRQSDARRADLGSRTIYCGLWNTAPAASLYSPRATLDNHAVIQIGIAAPDLHDRRAFGITVSDGYSALFGLYLQYFRRAAGPMQDSSSRSLPLRARFSRSFNWPNPAAREICGVMET